MVRTVVAVVGSHVALPFRPVVVLTTGVLASDDHLPVRAVEDLDGLGLLVTLRKPGSKGELERPDLLCLLRSELEDHFVAMRIVPPANDKSRGVIVDEGVELVGLEGPVSRDAIDVDTDDPTVFWTGA